MLSTFPLTTLLHSAPMQRLEDSCLYNYSLAEWSPLGCDAGPLDQ